MWRYLHVNASVKELVSAPDLADVPCPQSEAAVPPNMANENLHISFAPQTEAACSVKTRLDSTW